MSGAVETVQVRYETEDELWYAYVRSLAEDAFFAPGSSAPPGAEVRLTFVIPGREALVCRAKILDRSPGERAGRFVALQPTGAFDAFAAKKRSQMKEGRSQGTAGGMRAHARYDTCLEVEFRNYPELSVEYASNISRGGLFVRTATPPPMGSSVKLAVTLPDGQRVETEARVAHVITPEQAASRGVAAGAGLSWTSGDATFHDPFDRLIAEYQTRRPRVLVAEHHASIRAAFAQALQVSGFDVDVAVDGPEAFRTLLDGIFSYDLLIADLELGGLDGKALVDRIRRMGGETDLRIVLLVSGDPAEHRALEGRAGANRVLARQPPSEELVRSLLELLGRG